jgi:hypothetical protein
MLTVRTPYQVDGYTDEVRLPISTTPTLAELGIDKRLY